MVMTFIQLMISLLLKSFALPVGIALVGGISCLVLLTKDLSHIRPYFLMAYGMNSSLPQQMLETSYVPLVGICVIFVVILM